MQRIVIVGAGHAAAQLCASLTEFKLEAEITLVGQEPLLPYHRPPLSKGFIKDIGAEPTLIRSESTYQAAQIRTLLGTKAKAIDRAAQTLVLDNGERLPYDTLVLATGSRPRQLTGVPDGASGLLTLRNAADAKLLRDELLKSEAITVLGGGFIGLEVAASARALGKQVRIIESGPRLQARASSPEVSEFLAHEHRASGITIELRSKLEGLSFDDQQRLRAVRVNDQEHPTTLLLVGIGAVPQADLAINSGLDCDGGVLVDDMLRTSDPLIYAIGDCAHVKGPNGPIRIESIQNANDQARALAATLSGRPQPQRVTPWFWSEQGTLRLQIAGLLPADAERLRREGNDPKQFSILHYVGDQLMAVESINAPLDHMAARKILEQGGHVSREAAMNTAVPLKQFITV